MNDSNFAYLLLSLVQLLVAAHAFGYLFERAAQPRVVGEILGGLVLGPTFIARVFPDFSALSFGAASTATVLGATSKLGLMLLMFCSGLEIRASFAEGERRRAVMITVAGTVLPFAAALLLSRLVNLEAYHGPAASELTFNLVVAIAFAVTSIPVISKIMLDLGITDTPFARLILSAAVIEDVLLYVVLSIVLANAQGAHGTQFGLVGLLGLAEGAPRIAYHVIATLLFFVVALRVGPRLYDFVARFRYNFVLRGNRVGHLLAFLMLVVGMALFLSVPLMFGAFLAGVVVSASTEDASEERSAIKAFSSGFFVPLYFALVGFRLDLVRTVPWLFLFSFILACCLAKLVSVYVGARAAGLNRAGSLNVAAAMNARGGPGIVLATVALEAELITESFYAVLVIVAIVTSLMAGTWLGRAVRRGETLL